jgi:hypothetical protein
VVELHNVTLSALLNLIRLAVSSAILSSANMESRQPKRMKKRRDLDKLLASSGRGLIVSKRRRLVGEHSSSEEAEFTSVVPDSNYRGSSRYHE